MPDSKPLREPPRQENAGVSETRVLEAKSLLQGERQVVIRHSGEEYRLIVTRNNRLILQK